MNMELSLEQQINLRIYQQAIDTMSEQEVKAMLSSLIRQTLIKDNIIRSLIKDQWSDNSLISEVAE